MSLQLSPEAVRNAPKVWVANASGARFKIIDPRWRDKMAEAKRIAEIQDREQQRAAQIKADRDERHAQMLAAGAERDALQLENVREWYAAANAAMEPEGYAKCLALNIMKDMADLYRYTVEDIRSQSKPLYLARARHHMIYEVARACPHLSYTQIGKVFKRNHSSVIHAVRTWPAKAAALGIPIDPLNRVTLSVVPMEGRS